MIELLSISVVSCEDSSLRKYPTQTQIRTLLSIELCVEPFDFPDASCHAVTYLKALAVQVYKCLTELFSWSINSDSLVSVVRASNCLSTTVSYIISMLWVAVMHRPSLNPYISYTYK